MPKICYATVTFLHKYRNWKLKLRRQRGNTSEGLRADRQIYVFVVVFFLTFREFDIFSKDMLGRLRDSLDLWEMKTLDYEEAKCNSQAYATWFILRGQMQKKKKKKKAVGNILSILAYKG